ncbi:hypothetical protein [Paraburkholderia youngii]|uniref:hypothetical protein n=1 Tax=Paraburkholderia youngii TaxID=2782701 RepID=UPI003D1FD131
MRKSLFAGALCALTLSSAFADQPAPPTVRALPVPGALTRPNEKLIVVSVRQDGHEAAHALATPPATAITVSVVEGGKLKDTLVALLEDGAGAHLEPTTVYPIEVHQVAGLPHPARLDGDPGWWTLGLWNAKFDDAGNATLHASLFEIEPDKASVLREFALSIPAGQKVATIHGDFGHDYLLSVHRCSEMGCK